MEKCKTCYFPQVFIKLEGKIYRGQDRDFNPIYKTTFWCLGGVRRTSILADYDYFLAYDWYLYHRRITDKTYSEFMHERGLSGKYRFELIKKHLSLKFPEKEEVKRYTDW